ncbi:hypothetical protein [Micrococcoides hystricis]|uniref:Uncharacterized protein n=1 Tax=Micrococcoides hystricis TaxID=1572761 RepID=A0ABV6P9Z7_9MICC
MNEQPQTLRINWQRVPFAVVGLVSLVAIPVTVMLANAGVVGWSWPLLFGFLTFASVGSLRMLAIRSEYKPHGYHQSPTAASYQRKNVPGLTPRNTAADPFDASQELNAETTEADTAEAVSEHSSDAVEAELQQEHAASETVTDVVAAEAETTWEPVEVPAPKYTREAKAERAEPEPLELPEEPKASVNRLKDTLLVNEDLLREQQERIIRTSVRAHQPKAGALNLDDVLERRRA